MDDRPTDYRIKEIRDFAELVKWKSHGHLECYVIDAVREVGALQAELRAEREYGHMSVEDFAALWRAYAQAPDETLDRKARELKYHLLEITGQTRTCVNLVDQRSHDLIVAKLQAEIERLNTDYEDMRSQRDLLFRELRTAEDEREEWEKAARLVAQRLGLCPFEDDLLSWALAEVRKGGGE